MRLYLDTAPVIYLIENVPEYSDIVDQIFQKPDVVLISSDLTRLECRVKPIQENNLDLLKDYDNFFSNIVTEIITLSKDVLDQATSIRATHNLKTPDAIHLAAAITAKCDQFLTNDQRLSKFPDIEIHSLT